MVENARTPPAEPPPAPNAGSPERLYRSVLRALYEGRLIPGQRLAEIDLRAQFGAGRSTIREVIPRLAAAGVVTVVRHRGAAVRRLSRREVGEVLDLVEVLFGLAARDAARQAERLGAASAAALSDSYGALARRAPETDFGGFLEARDDFYRTVVRLSGNRELARIFPAVQVHLMRLQLRGFGNAGDGLTLEDYRAIKAAILKGDPARAEAAARRHVQHTIQAAAAAPDIAFRTEES